MAVARRGWRGRWHAAVAGLVLVALVWLPSASSPSSAAPIGPIKILIIGDSMTQGSAGDWTWRYRLWKQLDDAGVDVDFVGPNDDLYDNLTFDFGSHDYVDPAFDQDHAARWGMALAFPDHPIGELIDDYQPDVIVEMLGVNDLTWLQGTPAEARDGMRQLVTDARAADPDIDVVLGRIPQPWLDKIPVFNDLLDGLAADMDTPASRVVTAQSDTGMVLHEDTWDEHHPNSRGELKIAAGVEDALAVLGVGPPAARPLPVVPRGPRIPPVLAVTTPQLRSAYLTWLRSPGSTESEVWLRDLTTGEGWRMVADHLEGEDATLDQLPGWHHLQLRTAPWKGEWRADEDAWSNVVDIEVPDDTLDRPVVHAVADRSGTATVGWAAVAGATSYTVQWRLADQPGSWLGSATTSGTSTEIGRLAGRSGYVVVVRAERPGIVGDFSVGASVEVPPLTAVRGVRARLLPGGALKATGRTVADATGYTLRVARADSCRRPPKDRRFEAAATGVIRPARRLRVAAPAVWVRWVAVRDGVEGEVGGSSTACVRLHD